MHRRTPVAWLQSRPAPGQPIEPKTLQAPEGTGPLSRTEPEPSNLGQWAPGPEQSWALAGAVETSPGTFEGDGCGMVAKKAGADWRRLGPTGATWRRSICTAALPGGSLLRCCSTASMRCRVASRLRTRTHWNSYVCSGPHWVVGGGQNRLVSPINLILNLRIELCCTHALATPLPPSVDVPLIAACRQASRSTPRLPRVLQLNATRSPSHKTSSERLWRRQHRHQQQQPRLATTTDRPRRRRPPTRVDDNDDGDGDSDDEPDPRRPAPAQARPLNSSRAIDR